MDAKFNFLIDSTGWRIMLNLTGFALWLAGAYALMQLAS